MTRPSIVDTPAVARPSALSFAALIPGLPAQDVSRVAGVVAVSLGISVGIGIAFPLLPALGRDLDLSLVSIGVLVAAFGVARLVIDAVGGPLFRLVSERGAATIGAAVVAVGSFMTAAAGQFGELLVARILHGVGVALFVNAGAVYLGRETPYSHRARVLGLHQSSMLLGMTLGPVVGGLLATIGGLHLPFLIAGLTGIAAVPYSRRQFPARVAVPGDVTGHQLSVARPLRWSLAVAFVSYLVVWGTRSSVRFTLLPLYVDEALGASVLWTSLIFTIVSCGDVAGFFFGGWLADTVGRRRLLVWGFGLCAVIVCGWAATNGVFQLLPLAVAFGLVSGLVGSAPTAMAADIAGRKASTMTTLRLGGDAGIMIGPLLASTSAGAGGYGAAFLMHGAVFATAGLLALSARETRHLAGDGTIAADPVGGSSVPAPP